ncbi:MAG: hypothetical protein U9Q12_02275 [Patescibacteria group bacterium]|nr:hypothetical protein [Patescibacteria group bacterium]
MQNRLLHTTKHTYLYCSIFLLLFFPFFSISAIGPDDCKSGHTWKPRSGVGCVQTNCNDVPHAHWGYTQNCVCGSSGSIHENPDDPNKECYYPSSHTACPGCVYACVHADDKCPTAPGLKDTIESDTSPPKTTQPKPPQKPPIKTNTAQVPQIRPTLSTQATTKRTCTTYCAKLKMGGQYDEVLEASGTYPKCKCTVDIKDNHNRITHTITQNGDKRSTYTYDPLTGNLITKNTISLAAERERIRQRLGFKYSEEEIDALLDETAIDKWFEFMMQDIDTRSSITDPQFWWQHVVALLDHGYDNSADFVDTYQFGRCGDSMQWLERNLAKDIKLNGKNNNLNEAMLSITGEKYGNMLNHTALIIRPTGISNIAWADMVSELTTKTRAGGLTKSDIKNIDPQLLNATVLDPYFKKKITVQEFIKGWSVIKIS